MNLSPAALSRRTLFACTAALLGGALHAQTAYPNKPIRIVVPYAPGGSVDMVGRVIGDILAKQLGTTVVIENLPGAAGVVGAQRVVSSKPDGYTLLAGSSNEMAGTKFVNAAQKYDPAVDLTPIALTASAPSLWVAGAHVPVKNMDEFIKLVKANPGKYSYGSPGIGSTPHFSGELIKKTAGVHLVHIPYKGSPAMTGDLGGGNLDFAILSPMASAPLVQSGKIKILGATTAERISSLKNVPALAEHPALKGYALSGWFALAAPKGLPADIVASLQKAVQAGLADPAIRQRLEAAGTPPATGTESLAQVIRTDMGKYAELVKFANITLDN
ncbi:Bug family tripartite tricarboxylate transporter substrate binding protein [Comamonas terrigena]|uniref:Tripartite tricarboxylate transporter substrate binding protein n=1 Tax=Comamonas terrigena TaxID=32013 RepID=A0A2A7UWH5_COMTR|nr:tripartite tricarboxylate transporter substrate binding protein [Comamonas terrigena]PEH89594.1 tripartite tricarboxylate transporter substrate binding protein [Comamonas terrigena]